VDRNGNVVESHGGSIADLSTWFLTVDLGLASSTSSGPLRWWFERLTALPQWTDVSW
jgi:hypothetical protein